MAARDSHSKDVAISTEKLAASVSSYSSLVVNCRPAIYHNFLLIYDVPSRDTAMGQQRQMYPTLIG